VDCPQLQLGPQVHGEQVHAGLPQLPACSLVVSVMADSFR
jgi:hypothetical protein